jgi:hypothetical protein
MPYLVYFVENPRKEVWHTYLLEMWAPISSYKINIPIFVNPKKGYGKTI